MKKFLKEEFYTYNLFLNKGLYTSLVCEYKPAILSTGSEGFIELAVSSCLLTDMSHYTTFVDQIHDHNKQKLTNNSATKKKMSKGKIKKRETEKLHSGKRSRKKETVRHIIHFNK